MLMISPLAFDIETSLEFHGFLWTYICTSKFVNLKVRDRYKEIF